MIRYLLLSLAFLTSGFSIGQEVIWKIEVSSDSILMGNYFEVRFTVENTKGEFEAPEFEGFEILSGPNTTSKYSFINGKVSQEASYTYMIRPLKEGRLYIEPSYLSTGENVYETEPLLIQVYPNPEGIVENKLFRREANDPFFQRWEAPDKGPKFKHKKRKI